MSQAMTEAPGEPVNQAAVAAELLMAGQPFGQDPEPRELVFLVEALAAAP
jgi:hypothetical protein